MSDIIVFHFGHVINFYYTYVYYPWCSVDKLLYALR